MMTSSSHTQLLVIGGGPGGYVAAIRAAQLGISTTLVDAEGLGGTCLNIGCIPSKALIHAASEFAAVQQAAQERSPVGIQAKSAAIDLGKMQDWKQAVVGKLTTGVGGLLRKEGVRVVKGWARIVDGKTVDVDVFEAQAERIQCEHLLLATGSEPVALPGLPFGGDVVSSTGALSFRELPPRLVVVGAGYIGLELGIAWRKLGAQVSIVEAGNRILPVCDEEITRPVLARLRSLGISVYLESKAEQMADRNEGLVVRNSHGDVAVLPAERVLVAVGRRPRTSGYNLESLDLAMTGSAIQVDDGGRTSMRNVWAIGDVTGEPMLAHRAMAQAEVAAECIAGHRRHFDPIAVPAICFTDPEVVTVGRTTKECEASGVPCISASFPFAANGRSLSVGSGEGFVRVVARKQDQLLLGWQAVGAGVSELAAAFSYSLEMGARLQDIGGIIHAHPSLGEVVQEAALRAMGKPLHV